MQLDFGKFLEPDEGREYLIIHFSPTSLPLQQRWRNNGLSADFLAEYWSTFFPTGAGLSQQQHFEIKGVISYIANELLENVMKFSYKPANYAANLKLYLFENEFRFYTQNAIDPQTVADFQQRIRQLLSSDLQQLYVQQIKQSQINGSQLGLLTMIHDYGVQMAWRFEYILPSSERINLTTMVRLELL
jgi:hypothetical protein